MKSQYHRFVAVNFVRFGSPFGFSDPENLRWADQFTS
jgi:hypothetical protein